MSKALTILTVALSALCLLAFISIEAMDLNVRLIVALFWAASVCSLLSLFFARPTRWAPLAGAVCAWLMLWPTADSALAWSAWWVNGFGP
jgi:hypothetical protein